MVRLTILIASLSVLSACSEVPTVKVQQEDVNLTVQASGELESKEIAIIAPPAVARMWQYQVKTLVPENASVKKGQVVVSFDDKKLTERLFDKQGELSQASKELENKEMKSINILSALFEICLMKRIFYLLCSFNTSSHHHNSISYVGLELLYQHPL